MNDQANIFKVKKIKINNCHILKEFGKFYLKVIDSKLVLTKSKLVFEPKYKK